MWLFGASGKKAPPASFVKRLLLLAGMAALLVLLHWPTLAATRPYGPPLGTADWMVYPEAGKRGRGSPGMDDTWMESLRNEWRESVETAFVNKHNPFLPRVHAQVVPPLAGSGFAAAWTLLAAAGVALGWRSLPALRRLWAFVPATLIGHFVAYFGFPLLHLPDRLFRYPAQLLWILLGPLSLMLLSRRLGALLERRHPGLGGWTGRLGGPLLLVAVLALFGGMPSAGRNLSIRLHRADRRLLEFIATLPPDALIAGWPDSRVINTLPYMTARRVLVSKESSLAYHRNYVHETRRRTRALFEAYFATNVAPWRALRERWNVTHLIVKTDIYEDQDIDYYLPYERWIRQARAAAGTNGMETLRRRAAAVYDDGKSFVLDLTVW